MRHLFAHFWISSTESDIAKKVTGGAAHFEPMSDFTVSMSMFYETNASGINQELSYLFYCLPLLPVLSFYLGC